MKKMSILLSTLLCFNLFVVCSQKPVPSKKKPTYTDVLVFTGSAALGSSIDTILKRSDFVKRHSFLFDICTVFYASAYFWNEANNEKCVGVRRGIAVLLFGAAINSTRSLLVNLHDKYLTKKQKEEEK